MNNNNHLAWPTSQSPSPQVQGLNEENVFESVLYAVM